LGNKLNRYSISSKTTNFNPTVFNLVICFSDLVKFFVNLVIFAEKPVAALRLSFHDANWWEHAEKETSSTDAVPA